MLLYFVPKKLNISKTLVILINTPKVLFVLSLDFTSQVRRERKLLDVGTPVTGRVFLSSVGILPTSV